MPFPVASDQYSISSEFGEHQGIDVAVPNGTAAVATIGGVVERVGFVTRRDGSPSYGNLIVFRDANGNRHYYAHLSGFNVKAGQKIKAGQVIGWTGNTGRSTGPHLHYEVRGSNGRQINPQEFIGGGFIKSPPRLSNIAPATDSRSGPAPLRQMIRDFYNPRFDISAQTRSINDALDSDDALAEDVILQASLDSERLLKEVDPVRRI